jgi:hypothetical protein
MIDKSQEECLFEVLKLFQDLGLNKHIILIGSWVEYFYDAYFPHEFFPEIATRDIDFLYRNLRLPNHKIPLIKSLKDHGFIYDEHPLTKVARFYKSNIIELEFMTRVVGQDMINYDIRSLGIVAEGIRELNLLEKYCVEVTKREISVLIPQPAVYVVHKILIFEKRCKQGKSEKDIRSVKNILRQIMNSPSQIESLTQIVENLTKKERKMFDLNCKENNIDLSIYLEVK